MVIMKVQENLNNFFFNNCISYFRSFAELQENFVIKIDF